MSDLSSFVLFFGRFHPLLVHLPIGILVLLAFLELLGRNPRHRAASASTGYLLALAVPTSVFTALLGWFLSREGGYDAQLLNSHFWTGLLTALLCAMAATLYWFDLKKAYRGCLAITLVALVFTSHFGGSLTHGNDYLVRHAPAPVQTIFGFKKKSPSPALAPASATPVFDQVIFPILEQNCIACHGPEKSKGDLRVDTVAFLLKGGDAGPAIIPGKAAESEMMKRIHLPLDDDDHMPPDGKPQPSKDKLALLAWWIDSGASATEPAHRLKQTPEVRRLLETPAPRVRPESVEKVVALPREQALQLASELSAELRVTISPLAESEPWLMCNASLASTNFGDDSFLKLARSPIAKNIVWLDLSGSAVSDAGIAGLTNFPALTRLHLARTPVTDNGLACVASLSTLEYLNLYGARISDGGLNHLKSLPKLTQVYLWGTAVTEEGAKGLESARQDEAEVARIEQEIERLQARLKAQRVSVHLGAARQELPSPHAVAGAVNTACPISGKPVNPAKTMEFEGHRYAFCCDDCLHQAKANPKAALAQSK